LFNLINTRIMQMCGDFILQGRITLRGWGGGGGVLLGILGGGVPPGSPNPDPISDQKMSFSRPVSRPDL